MSKLGRMAMVVGAIDIVPEIYLATVKWHNGDHKYAEGVAANHRIGMGLVGAGLVDEFWPKIKKMLS